MADAPQIHVEITLSSGAIRTIVIDPKKLTLGFYADMEEAQETKQFRPMLRAYQQLFKLPDDEMREITIEQLETISNQLKAAGEQRTALPNG